MNSAIISETILQRRLTGINYDLDYQSLLNRGSSLGYVLPSVPKQIKGNQLIIDLKNSGIWDLLDILYAFRTDGSNDFATLNWKNPSLFQAQRVNSPTFTSNAGFTGNDVSSYLNTNWIPSINGVNFTLDSCSLFCDVNNNISTSDMASGGLRIYLMPRRATGDNQPQFRVNDAADSTATGSSSSIGLFQIGRASSTNNYISKNGSVLATPVVTSTSVDTHSIAVLARQTAPGTFTGFSAFQVGFFGIGASLSGLQDELNTAWNNYKS